MKLLREFIAQTLSRATSGNKTIQGAPLRHGVGVRPQASSNVLADEEAEWDSLPKAACVLITREDGMVLGVSRKHDPTAFGLPGGKLDSGETAEEAAARELYEETGLSITNLRPIFTRSAEGEFQCVTFTGSVSGDIKTSEEGVVKWVDVETLLAGPFGDYNRLLFQQLGRV